MIDTPVIERAPTDTAKNTADIDFTGSVNRIRAAGSQTYKEMVTRFELELINSYVEEYGSVKKAAEVLSVHPSLIWRKLHDNAKNNQ